MRVKAKICRPFGKTSLEPSALILYSEGLEVSEKYTLVHVRKELHSTSGSQANLPSLMPRYRATSYKQNKSRKPNS